ncbi:hypothetical protein FGIG_02428 [Fasciola gigantica]|uniref:Uncharacterized protein n=1 Tax=Fasciola gigantica TaxID=46835 RepID=A0A504YZ86_FASGI|nr:hypothetical protein FGIG_02428 [Fasciola gigantica]
MLQLLETVYIPLGQNVLGCRSNRVETKGYWLFSIYVDASKLQLESENEQLCIQDSLAAMIVNWQRKASVRFSVQLENIDITKIKVRGALFENGGWINVFQSWNEPRLSGVAAFLSEFLLHSSVVQVQTYPTKVGKLRMDVYFTFDVTTSNGALPTDADYLTKDLEQWSKKDLRSIKLYDFSGWVLLVKLTIIQTRYVLTLCLCFREEHFRAHRNKCHDKKTSSTNLNVLRDFHEAFFILQMDLENLGLFVSAFLSEKIGSTFSREDWEASGADEVTTFVSFELFLVTCTVIYIETNKDCVVHFVINPSLSPFLSDPSSGYTFVKVETIHENSNYLQMEMYVTLDVTAPNGALPVATESFGQDLQMWSEMYQGAIKLADLKGESSFIFTSLECILYDTHRQTITKNL